jgi:hypothetical protein
MIKIFEDLRLEPLFSNEFGDYIKDWLNAFGITEDLLNELYEAKILAISNNPESTPTLLN